MTIPRLKIKASLSPPKVRVKAPAPFPVAVAGTGGLKVSKSNGVWVIEPDFAQLATVLASAIGDPTAKQVWIWDAVTNDYNVLTLAGLGDALYKLTSTTPLAIGAGAKIFSTQSGKDIGLGTWVLATSDANPTANWMLGQVTDYSDTSLTINVSVFSGSGTSADWTIRPSGARGPDRSAGLFYKWSTSTAAADPGAGFVRANNATFASITALYISETDFDGNAIAAELATWGAGTSAIKGRLKLYDPVTPTNFMTFDVTAFADSGAYDTLTVTPIASGGSFSASAQLRVHFTPKGDLGQTGPQGVNAGVNINFDVSTTMANPGTGNLRLNGNSAAPGSITALAISSSAADAGNPSIAALVNTWDDSSTSANRGTLTVRKASDTSKWAQFRITGALTDNATWLQIPLAYLAGPGAFSAADSLVVIFDRTGDAGTLGVSGAPSAGNVASFANATTVQDAGYAVTSVLRKDTTAAISKGYTITPNNLGTIASFAVDPTLGNYQYGTNNGAFTLTAPTSDSAVDLLVTNGATAGSITFSGFTVGPSTGDPLTTTNGHRFLISIRRINAVSTYVIKALQ
jgi:hypothetical protein